MRGRKERGDDDADDEGGNGDEESDEEPDENSTRLAGLGSSSEGRQSRRSVNGMKGEWAEGRNPASNSAQSKAGRWLRDV